MLNIYYGRETIQKDKFIFDHIKGKTLLLVPDQFTLQAERDAFFYLGVKGLMDLEVVNISRLGLKVLQEVGGGKTTLINKYGRHMLLAKILGEKKDELDLYRGLEKKTSFMELANDFISEMKQYNTGPDRLADIIAGLDDNTFLKRKLTDIQKIYESYEAHIQGKYLDTEDMINLYAGKIARSKRIRDSVAWVYGFDVFTPKNVEIIGKLMKTAVDTNVVLTYGRDCRDDELFRVTGMMADKLCRLAEEQTIPWAKTPIDDAYAVQEKAPAIAALEQELYAIPAEPVRQMDGVTLLKAANLYAEAESAAAEVLALVRDQGMAYRDMVVICNDMEDRGPMVKRVFSQYGINLFLDKKRSILHNPASGFILSLLDTGVNGYRREDVFRLLKSGLTDLDWAQVEQLENYAVTYRIKGSMWKKPFIKGLEQYGPEGLQELETSRQQLTGLVEPFTRDFESSRTVKEKVSVLYDCLRGPAGLPDKLEALMKTQEETGFLDAAGETAQVWGFVMDILDQFVEIVGEEALPAENFRDILQAGFESVEIGLLPPAADGLMMGTMQRTRSSHVKAMLVLGANEGLLPASAPAESLLSEDEKSLLAEQSVEICKLDELRLQEERLAIYKNLSKPSRRLWVSYSASDAEGKESRPSTVFCKLAALYPGMEIQKDILNRGDPMERIQARENTLQYMTRALREAADGAELPGPWQEALRWYREKGDLSKVREGLLFTNQQPNLEEALAGELYRKEAGLVVSPTRLETYSRCPFSHFIHYGLRPWEDRPFEVGGREIGDLYHLCLMGLSRWLTEGGTAVNDPASPWMTVTREQCGSQIEKILLREIVGYREGLLHMGGEEIYRVQRLQEVCTEIGWILVDHVRRGGIKTIAFEEAFGRGRRLAPVEVETPHGTVLIEGKIDRVDVLADDRVKIIDYKTGSESFTLNEAKKGFRLQLMLYLKAARGQSRQPAGVFYFHISEPSVNAEGMKAEDLASMVPQEVKKAYRLEGVMVDRPEVVENIAGDFTEFSDIAPVRKSGKGVTGTGAGRLLEEEEFEALQEEVDQKVKELCDGLLTGHMEIRPKKTKQLSACTYCPYKGICKFDLAFESCRYEMV